MTRLIVSVILLALASTAQTKLYLELSIEDGGDTLIGTSAGEEINAGGRLKLALGIQKELGETGGAPSLSLGK